MASRFLALFRAQPLCSDSTALDAASTPQIDSSGVFAVADAIGLAR